MRSSALDLPAARQLRSDLRLQGWYEVGWLRPLAGFLVVFGSWLGLFACGLWVEHWGVRAVLVVPLTMSSGFLFTLAHDAGHGSFSASRKLNGVVGRLALVPSLHVFGLWRMHHDLHHRYTNLRQRDFVWTPLTAEEYRNLSGRGRLLHRLCRHRSGLGLGVHYAVEIWGPRMLIPRRSHGTPPGGPGHLVDTLCLYVSLSVLAIASVVFVSTVDPARSVNAGSWVWTAVLLFVVPLIGTHWLIGFVIYLNHTHPDIVWYEDALEWSRNRVQLEGSAGVLFGGLGRVFMPGRIMNHTVHHLDPAVPLGSLKPAQEDLVAQHADSVTSWRWSPRRFRQVLSQCKLYDYEEKRWLTYDEAEQRR